MHPTPAQPPQPPCPDMPENRHLSHLFDTVLMRHAGQTVKVSVLVNALEARGFGVLLILFTLPLAIPVPKPPPLDTILGIPLFYLCLQMIQGRAAPHLPRRVMDQKISVDFLIRAFSRGRKWLERLEKLFHPRLTTIPEDRLIKICGYIGMISTCSVIIPFPMSNTIPSICMLVMAMGLVMRDGLAAIAGGISGALWVLMLACLVAFGAGYVLDWLGGLF